MCKLYIFISIYDYVLQLGHHGALGLLAHEPAAEERRGERENAKFRPLQDFLRKLVPDLAMKLSLKLVC